MLHFYQTAYHNCEEMMRDNIVPSLYEKNRITE